jgi:uncharacterized membrane protein YGL010W
MQNVESLFADYASYHRTTGNKAFHRIGIPMIMLTLIGMLTHVRLFELGTVRFDLAILLIAAAAAYYFVLEWRLAIPMVVVSIVFYYLGAAIPLLVNAALFVLGWVLQFIGHSVYEKRQPAFFRNFVHLLVGPLWILNDVMGTVKGARERS